MSSRIDQERLYIHVVYLHIYIDLEIDNYIDIKYDSDDKVFSMNIKHPSCLFGTVASLGARSKRCTNPTAAMLIACFMMIPYGD